VLLQTLLSIALIAVLAGSLVTGALIDVKVATNQAVARATSEALGRGTDEFVNYAQLYVAHHGASSSWPTARVTDQPAPICPASMTAAGTCAEFATISYAVVGSSAGSTSGPDPAQNLQVAVNENRIAGTVTATITSADGTIQGSRTRAVTLRIFDASPFAVLTGARDATTIAGSVGAGEGDTGGYRVDARAQFNATPNPAYPWAAKDTSIEVSMTCSNSANNSNQTQPSQDNHSPGNDSTMWGKSGGTGFEAPCAPTYAFSSVPIIPIDAPILNSNVYEVGLFRNSSWVESISVK
jgi:hypothetical protein